MEVNLLAEADSTLVLRQMLKFSVHIHHHSAALR